MKNLFSAIFCLALLVLPLKFSAVVVPGKTVDVLNSGQPCSLYEKLSLAKCGLSKSAYEKAISNFDIVSLSGLANGNILTVIDYSQPSTSKRLYVLDLFNERLLLQTYVAHGRNSGEDFARTFSNSPQSYMSSPGLYFTGDTYVGKHGLSLHLIGKEKDINDNAFTRSIVFHGASYVSDDFIKKYGRLGRSQGCPAVSEELSSTLINMIKGGSCVYIYTESN